MIRQLFKLCWNRKRAQALVAVEVFFSFLVVFAIMTVVVYNLDNYRQPLGFDYKDVLNVSLQSLSDVIADSSGRPTTATEDSRRLLREVKGLDEVEGVAGMAIPPFDLTGMNDVVEYEGRRFESYNNQVTDDFATVMRLQVTEGRWFEAADDALAYDPVVINERLKRDLFGGEDPLGKDIAPRPDPAKAGGDAARRSSGWWASSPTSARTASCPDRSRTSSSARAWRVRKPGPSTTSRCACGRGPRLHSRRPS